MSLPEPKPGLVIRYDYLWADEHDAGREEAAKTRPCVIVVATQHVAGELLVTVVPVTHVPQAIGSIRLPAQTKMRLRLDDEASWVICTEVNRFVWPGPDLRPVPPDRRWSYGLLPNAVFQHVRRTLVSEIRRRQLRVIPRA